MVTLGPLIKDEIKKQGKTQRWVAARVGISTNALSQICIGSTLPQKQTLEKLCEVLEIEIELSIVKRNNTHETRAD